MAVSVRDFEPLLTRDGPISVVNENGNAITHAPSGIARSVDPDNDPVLALHEIELVLLDELARPVRSIRSDQIKEIRRTSPGWQIMVAPSVEPDEGKLVRTRGA